MVFPFFCLPFELREMIYEEIFRTRCRGKVINPDPTYSRRGHEGETAARTINSGSELLRSCQQAHNEGVAVLYGSNVFSFDDTEYGTLTSELEHSEDDDARTYLEICSLPRGDYVLMYEWLVTIGYQNRLRIRHLELGFSRFRFMVINEAPLPPWVYRPPTIGDGVFLKNALQLLASAHHLETVSLSFRKPSDYDCQEVNKPGFVGLFLPNCHWYYNNNYFPTDLKSALSSVKGIKRLHCADIPMSDDLSSLDRMWNKDLGDANASLWEVRRVMESGYTAHKGREDPTFEAGTFVDQVEYSMQIWQEMLLEFSPGQPRLMTNHCLGM